MEERIVQELKNIVIELKKINKNIIKISEK